MPTLEALTCINFQYGIVNNVGVTAQDIFNEVNNTLKTGLIIATRNVTIEILNETYPREQEEANRHLRTRQLEEDAEWKRKSSSLLLTLHDDETYSTNRMNRYLQIDSSSSQTQKAVNYGIGNVYRLEDKPFSDMMIGGKKGTWNFALNDPRKRKLPSSTYLL